MPEINYYYNNEHPLHPFTGSDEANINTGAPFNALRIAPEFKDGFHPCEKNERWILVRDYRGEKAYNKATGEMEEIKEIGELPENLTNIAPDVPFPVWDGEKWVTDKEAEKKDAIQSAKYEKQSRIRQATENIQPLQDAVDLNLATEEEKNKLKEWKIYRLSTYRIDESNAPDIQWPKKQD
ncbi:tail fiber assembly protein [Arsenophonus nasoniae]|uniref:tail fiber assembly protein n=1 Tax=Arsenophonus nasoniae TaxID=638 RepID=UPI00387984A4